MAVVAAPEATLDFGRQVADTLVLRLSGPWTIHERLPAVDEVQQELETGGAVRRLRFETEGLAAWDSALLTFLLRVVAQADGRGVAADRDGLPEGVRRLLALATAVPERRDTGTAAKPSWLARVGLATLEGIRDAGVTLTFLGEVSIAFARSLLGRARYRRSDFLLVLQEVGAQALPIVSLISFLVGVILAYVGAMQLRQFGAQVYVADLVGIAMTREMGAMMAGIIMAGRTGAAFAAQLGTMQVNEEIDALQTMGIPPMEFLVLPRMLALMLMMPLLCVYADMMGMLAGLLIGTGLLDLSLVEYVNETRKAVHLVDCGVGLGKSVVFGALVALAGCLRGMQCGRSASAVGAAATSAVVTGIVAIVMACGIFAVVFYVLGI